MISLGQHIIHILFGKTFMSTSSFFITFFTNCQSAHTHQQGNNMETQCCKTIQTSSLDLLVVCLSNTSEKRSQTNGLHKQHIQLAYHGYQIDTIKGVFLPAL